MIYHTSSILCEQILTSPRNNALSYINAIHERLLKQPIEEGKAINTAPFVVATKWFKNTKKEEKIQIRVSANLSDSEEHTILGETDVVLSKDTYVIAVNMEVLQFPVKTEGFYLIKIEHKSPKGKKWKEATFLPLRVFSREQTSDNETNN